MRMAKRVVQVLAVVGLMGTMYVSGAVQEKIEEPPVVQTVAEVESRTLSVVEPSSQTAILHEDVMSGCVTILDEVIAMSSELNLPERRVDEVRDEQDTVPVMGAVYRAAVPPLVGIDPGHLGYTSEKYFNTGAVSVNGTVEYEWTLEIAVLLNEELTARGYDTYLLRTTNEQKEFPYNNGQRAKAANSMNCDILVAIHWDSTENEEINGYHTIYRGNKTTASYRLAQAVSDSYGEAVEGMISKFVDPMSRKDLWELNEVAMPAIILECGYSSNWQDASWLEDPDNHSVIVKGIADGIDNYFEGER